MQEKLVELIIQNNPFDVPAVMVKKQTENRLNDYVRSLIARGVHPKTLDINWTEFQERQKELACNGCQSRVGPGAYCGERKHHGD
jgi:FKBP-type peptidyl-prolyl cis-trans isomerase (trigger factor)